MGINRLVGIVLLSIAVDVVAAQGEPPVTQRPQAAAPIADARPTTSAGGPPSVRWVEIRPDTPGERNVFLKERAATQRARAVSVVPPLPEQLVSPPAPRNQ